MRRGLDEFGTNQDLVRQVILENVETFPNVYMNYTLTMLLVLRKVGAEVSDEDILRASRGDLRNLTSVHRALTLVKKEFQTAREEAAMVEEESAWRRELGGGSQ